MARLGDIGKIITGNTPKTSETLNYSSNDICFIKPSDILEGEITVINDSEFYISNHARDKARILPPKCVLVTCIGIIGKVAINNVECAFNQQINAIVPDQSKCLTEYLAYAIRNKQKEMQDVANAPVVPILNKTQFSEIEIELPSVEEQTEVVIKMRAVDSLIFLRKQQLSKLDELVKSRFIEMFGDPKTNPNSFDIVPFNECVEYMGDIGSNGANQVVVDHLDMKDEEDYALMVRFLNFTKNDFADDVKYISKESYEFFKKSQIFGGELIICKIGSAGQNYVMPYLNRPVSLGLNQIMVRINGKTLMPYLYRYINSDYGKQLINGCINGAVTKSITKTELKKIPIVIPPIELQTQFAAFVEQTDKSKFEIQESLEKLETLKKSLMQKYFG